ncbi:MAG: ABC transporter permease [Clostridiales bacterium]|jgi:ABC-type dipeptide/oligopeptide/nickel transport system permease subunit|nr:ABC transporter permease [Clostridiales bacterium]
MPEKPEKIGGAAPRERAESAAALYEGAYGALEETPKQKSQFLEILKRMSYSKVNVICLAIVLFFGLVAVLAPLIAPYGYADMVAQPFLRPSAAHLFGTDNLGRDVLSRVMHGAKYSIGLGLAATGVSLAFGMFLGAIAGYYGGKVDDLLMRFCDIIQSIPGLLLNMALCVAFGTGVANTIFALGVGGIAASARLMRSSFLNLRKAEFVDAARSISCSDARIISRHIIPNAFAPVLVQTTMNIGAVIMTAAGLNFLGLGVQAPRPEWGALLSGGRDFIRKAPWLCIFPGCCILVLVLSLNLVGDGLRDAMDPKLKK